ncbi:MAG: hypothetical protein K9N23_06615 [Akkermansiaceae bacterium]|nr:hypothetical protein [Akkermansiaceae bacterium]
MTSSQNLSKTVPPARPSLDGPPPELVGSAPDLWHRVPPTSKIPTRPPPKLQNPHIFLPLAAGIVSMAREKMTCHLSESAPARRPLTAKNRVWDFFRFANKTRPANRRQPLQPRRKNRPAPTKTASGIPCWPSRDPIGERGGVNLYGFGGGNDGVDGIDVLGENMPSIPKRKKIAFIVAIASAAYSCECDPDENPEWTPQDMASCDGPGMKEVIARKTRLFYKGEVLDPEQVTGSALGEVRKQAVKDCKSRGPCKVNEDERYYIEEFETFLYLFEKNKGYRRNLGIGMLGPGWDDLPDDVSLEMIFIELESIGVFSEMP